MLELAINCDKVELVEMFLKAIPIQIFKSGDVARLVPKLYDELEGEERRRLRRRCVRTETQAIWDRHYIVKLMKQYLWWSWCEYSIKKPSLLEVLRKM